MIEKEAPPRDKYSHDAVDYENRSTHRGQTCSNCSMFIAALVPRCTIVVRPIYAAGWCRKWRQRHQ